jgi:biotin operon repressor
METKDKVLAAIKEAEKPVSAGQIATSTGIDRKEIDKAMKQLKDSGAIISPVRCYWEAAK